MRLCIFIFLLITGCANKNKKSEVVADSNKVAAADTTKVSNVKLEVYNFNGFKSFLEKKDNTVYVINFWATWCAPCVKELPYFEKLNAAYDDVEVVLVSLDFPHLYESKLKPFIIDKKLKSKVIALDDVAMDTWIPKVDKTWSGSLPATLIYRNDSRKFFEQSFTYDTLEHEVKQFIK